MDVVCLNKKQNQKNQQFARFMCRFCMLFYFLWFYNEIEWKTKSKTDQQHRTKKRKEKIISVCASVPVTHGSGTVWIYCNNKFSNVNEMCGMRLLSRNFCKCSYLLMHLLAIMKENSFICDDSPTDLSFILWLRFLSRFLISLAAHSWFYFISRINWYASIFIYLLIASVRMINWFESRLFFFRCRCTVFCLIFIMIIFIIVVRHIFHVIFIQNNNKSFKIFFVVKVNWYDEIVSTWNIRFIRETL